MRGNYKIFSLFIICFLAILSVANAQLNKQFFYNQARNYISQDQYTEAINSLNTLIKADSTIAEAWFLRGLAKYNLNDLHGAQADFSKAIRHNPVFSQAYLYRGVVLSRFSRFTQAQSDFDMAIDLRPNSPDGYFSRGVNHLLTQQPKQSISDFNKVIQFQPKNLDAWINRGTAKLYDADSLGALADYTSAIRLNPFYPDSYSKRGRLYFEMNKFNLALDDLNKSISLEKENAINYFLRALTHNSLNNNDSALSDLNRAIELSPNNALSIYNRALILWKKGDIKLALRDFDRVAELNPENILVYFNRAVLLYEMDDFRESIEDFTKAIDIFPDFANAYLGRSAAHARLGNYFDSEMDKTYAQSIAERFSQQHSQPLTDTTQTLNNLIAFNSDFSPRTTIPLLDEFDARPVDILPFARVIAVPIAKLPIISQEFLPIDTLNSKLRTLGVSLTFSTSKNLARLDTLNFNDGFIDSLLKSLLFSNENRFRQAIDVLEIASRSNANNPLLLLNLAAEKADMVTFIATFEREIGAVSMEQRTRRQGTGNYFGSVQLESYNESLELLEKLNGLMPNQHIVLYNLANIYALSGNVDTAIELYSQAIKSNSNFAEAWYNRGLIHLMQKDNIQGCVDMGKAGELGIKQAYLLIHRFCRR